MAHDSERPSQRNPIPVNKSHCFRNELLTYMIYKILHFTEKRT